jgi:hypothetical protein
MEIKLKNKHTKSRLILTGFLSIPNLDRPNQKLGICLIFYNSFKCTMNIKLCDDNIVQLVQEYM